MDNEILQEFIAESWDHLNRLDHEIVTLEKDPGNSALLASIFRTIHTIKGTCGCIGLTNLGSVAHSAENVLGKMRDRVLATDSHSVTLILEAVDEIKALIGSLEATREELPRDNRELISRLNELAMSGDSIHASMTIPGETNSDTKIFETSLSELSVRVHVNDFNRLINLVEELSLTRNRLLQQPGDHGDDDYSKSIADLDRITSELQHQAEMIRMQPIGDAWSRLPRLVRNLAQSTGKQISLTTSGADIKLDRVILDAIKDPLTHIVRNAADHGIEHRELRLALGKPDVGTIRLDAVREGASIIVSIEDDGAGIDRDRVLCKAMELGLITPTGAEKLTDSQILSLIFKPGFTTAPCISSVSGRGVGMDVVKTAIEQIGGRVELYSVKGRGTKVRIKLPLTTAGMWSSGVESDGKPLIDEYRTDASASFKLNAHALQHSFERLAPQSDRLAKRFYDKLIKDFPRYKRLLADADMADLRRMLIQTIAIVIKTAQKPESLVKFLSAMGRQHFSVGVVPEDYGPMGQTLLAVIKQMSADHWDDELSAAWNDTVSFVAKHLTEGMLSNTTNNYARPVVQVAG